jgi:hypothetical protein
MYLRATVQDGVSGLNKQLQIFYFLCTNMAALFPFLRWRLRDIQTVAKFLLRKNKYGYSLTRAYIEKMAACTVYFLSASKILKH